MFINMFSDGLVGCIVGLTLVFGLLSIVLLLGYGLVEIPLSYFKFASNMKKLRYYLYKVAEYDSKLTTKSRKTATLIHVAKRVDVEIGI